MTDKLKAAALAAKECNRECGWYDFDTLAITYEIGHTDAMLIAAASPDVVLALIAENERIKESATLWNKRYQDACQDRIALRQKYGREIEALEVDIERLTLEKKAAAMNYDSVIEGLMAEVEQRTADWKEATAKNRELLAEVGRLTKANQFLTLENDDFRAEVERWKEAYFNLLDQRAVAIASGAAPKPACEHNYLVSPSYGGKLCSKCGKPEKHK